MHMVFRLNAYVVAAMGGLAMALVAFVMLGISAEVAIRALGWGSISGMIEGTEYALYFATFLAVPWILRSGEHIRVDFLVGRLPAADRRRIERFGTVVIIAVCAVLFWFGGKLFVDHLADGRLVFKDIVFPQWWIDWPVPLSALTTGLVALEQLVRGPEDGGGEAPGEVGGG